MTDGLSRTDPGAQAIYRTRNPNSRHDLIGSRLGTIPAGAGSTYLWVKRWPIRWDHPRGRGEHAKSLVDANSISGSSPQARGAHGALRAEQDARGTIPAPAGMVPPLPVPWRRPPSRLAPPAEPRVRGRARRPPDRPAAADGPGRHTAAPEFPDTRRRPRPYAGHERNGCVRSPAVRPGARRRHRKNGRGTYRPGP